MKESLSCHPSRVEEKSVDKWFPFTKLRNFPENQKITTTSTSIHSLPKRHLSIQKGLQGPEQFTRVRVGR